jgi:hypothetical protein
MCHRWGCAPRSQPLPCATAGVRAPPVCHRWGCAPAANPSRVPPLGFGARRELRVFLEAYLPRARPAIRSPIRIGPTRYEGRRSRDYSVAGRSITLGLRGVTKQGGRSRVPLHVDLVRLDPAVRRRMTRLVSITAVRPRAKGHTPRRRDGQGRVVAAGEPRPVLPERYLGHRCPRGATSPGVAVDFRGDHWVCQFNALVLDELARRTYNHHFVVDRSVRVELDTPMNYA